MEKNGTLADMCNVGKYLGDFCHQRYKTQAIGTTEQDLLNVYKENDLDQTVKVTVSTRNVEKTQHLSLNFMG